MDQNNIEIPEYFLCPISLQLMKDPVTTTSGITYDRESIEQWLFKSSNTTCPVTMQPLPGLSDLTPNHTLRRLIQAWCSLNGIHRIPTPKPILISKSYIVKLVRDLFDHPNLQKKTLQKLEALAVENVRNRVFMVEADLATALTAFIVSCHEKRCMDGIDEALSLVYVVWKSKGFSCEKDEIIDALVWVCVSHDDKIVKFHTAYMLKLVIKNASTGFLARLKPETFEKILSELRKGSMCKKGVDCLLHVLLDACPWGRNRVVMVGSGAVTDMIEVEMRSSEKRTSELVLGVLYHLCSCEDGRAQLVGHAAGIVAVTRRLLEVSATADERAVWIMWMISKYCGTNAVVEEMVRVGAVDKLCRVMVEDKCGLGVKEKAKEILRTHSHVWKLRPN